ncbi:MAG: mucoidy inhibitor MuiA family protein [Leptolyngbyaceae cyanobacterium RU_5_1]|nr:mucoidy inhibitor MuiA family protein [Leptolyngbyaceae cyanobacterium RU_5_1]
MSETSNPAITTIDTQISAVTVYTDQARVTRRGHISLTGQEQELILTNLPVTIQPESVRVKGTGTIAVRLLGVRTERIYATEPVAKRVAQVTEQIQQLQDQRRTLNDRLAALQLQQTFIQNLSEKSVDRVSRALAEQRVNLSQTGELLNFVGQQYGELAAAIAQQNQELRELDKHLQALQQQLQQVRTPRPQESYSLLVGIMPAGEGEFDLDVSYTVDRASWKPLYDLRVDTQRGQLQLDYLAEVEQSTGEDWSTITLTLSTAKPGMGSLPPKLDPWYITVPTPPPMPAAAPAMMRQRSSPALEKGDALGEVELNEEVLAALISNPEIAYKNLSSGPTYFAETVAAQISREGGVISFQIDGNSNIPSDGSPHKVTIFSDNEYPCQFEYIAIPKLVSFTYLQAIVTNPTDGATLLPGAANIFRDEMFVGTTQLENVTPGQEFKLNLGIDEGLTLERDLVERKVDKRFMQDKRLITYGYRLMVTNLRDRETTLRLTEQLPVSRNEHIKVRLTRTYPQIQPGEMGVLDWVLTLKPGSKQEISYQFTVEHPRELTVIGLDL